MSISSFLAILFGISSLILLWLFKMTLNCKDLLQKEKQELDEENKKLEYFISEYFLRRMNDQELLETFTSILDNYTQGKELPKNFLYLVCGYSKSFKLMHAAILVEIDRWGRFVLDKDTAPDLRKIALTKQQKLNDLLQELEEINIKKNGRVSITNLGDGSSVRHGHGGGMIQDA